MREPQAQIAQPVVHQLLDLERAGDDIFLGRVMSAPGRVFGGLVLGQAVAAANATIAEGRQLKALHAEFIREGDPSEPIHYRVERIRDGRTYTRRQVRASQRDQVIFLQTSSYGLDQPGPSRQLPTAPPVEDPDALPDLAPSLHGIYAGPAWLAAQPEIDLRMVATDADAERYGRIRFWYRYRAPMADDPLRHAALWAFFSDMSLLTSARLTHNDGSAAVSRWRTSSLDHALWLHGPVRCTSWLRVDQACDRVDAGFGVATARVFDEHGTQVSTIAQHGLIRAPR
jgi:acyl-CoA thioesterase II